MQIFDMKMNLQNFCKFPELFIDFKHLLNIKNFSTSKIVNDS